MGVRHIAKMIKSDQEFQDVYAVSDAQPCERYSAQLRKTGTSPKRPKDAVNIGPHRRGADGPHLFPEAHERLRGRGQKAIVHTARNYKHDNRRARRRYIASRYGPQIPGLSQYFAEA